MSLRPPSHWIGTDVGLVRDHNEDAFLWLGPDDTYQHGWLWVVADGMGGAAAGDLASALLISAMQEVYPEVVEQTRDPHRAMVAGIEDANRRILAAVETYPDLRGMGTTVAALAIWQDRAWVAWVGDSRVYWLHRGQLIQLTRDHTAASTLSEMGGVSRADAEKKLGASTLSRVVGRPGLQVDIGGGQPLPIDDETFLLCTDGVSAFVPEELLRHALDRLPARDATEAVVELARRQWSDDNLTAAIIRNAPVPAERGTTRDRFLAWAAGDPSAVDDQRTLMIQSVPEPGAQPLPPRTNITGIPRITATARAAVPHVPGIAEATSLTPEMRASLAATDSGSTSMFSPQQIAELNAAIGAPPAPAPPVASSAGPPSQGTAMFSPQQVAAWKEAAAKGQAPPAPAPAPAPPVASPAGPPTQGTAMFSPQQVAAWKEAATKGQAPPAPTPTAAPTAPPEQGTAMFSPQQVAAWKAAAQTGTPSGAPTAPATAPPPAAQTGGMGTAMFSPQQAAAMRELANAPTAERPKDLPHGGNVSTMFFSGDEMQRAEAKARIFEAASRRERTVMMSQDELRALAEAEPVAPKRSAAPLVIVAMLMLAAVAAVGAWFFLVRQTPAPVAEGSATPSITIAPNLPQAPEGLAPIPAPTPSRAIPAAPTPTRPAGVHDADAMPYYRVELADGRTLNVDAHEVLVAQMTRFRRDVPDMELVYSVSSQALYQFMPCDGVFLDGPGGTSRRPVCAAPEAAEAYCNAVGRRMPSPEDWEAVQAAAAAMIAPSRGQLWSRRADGAAPEQPADFAAIQGVYDGVPEVLRATREDVVSGTLPILARVEGGGPIVERRAGLLTELRQRSLGYDELPVLGFRCVSDGPPRVAAAEQARRPSRAATPEPEQRAPERTQDAAPPARREPARPTPTPSREAAPTPDEARPEPARPREITSQADREREAREAAAAQDDGAPRIQLMDPVYLPATIDEYEEQMRDP